MSVTDLLQWLSIATAAGLLMIAGLSLWDWLRFRDAGRGWLALAIGSLGVVSTAGQLAKLVPHQLAWLTGSVTLVVFMLSGLSLLLFRDTIIPLGRRLRLAAIAIPAVVMVLTVTASLETAGNASASPLQTASLFALVVIWSLSVGEPSLRFWLVSRRLPTVQRARLRALAAGYGAIVAILVIDVGAGSYASTPALKLISALIALGIVPLLYAGFAAPRWLRRLWRDSEEALVWSASHDILMYSPDRQTLATRALEWALRVAGGEKGFIAYPADTLLARSGLSEDEARSLQRKVGAPEPPRVVATGLSDEPAAIVTPLPAGTTKGALVLLSGPFTPVLGADEVAWVAQYALLIATGLERVALVEAVRQQTAQAETANRQLQAANKELEAFTYTVSHDLRAPLRAINGFTAILMDEHAAELTPESMGYLKRVAESGKHMGTLVDDLLAFSRLGRQQLTRNSVDTSELVRTVWNRLEPSRNGRAVELKVSPLPLTMGDRVLLEQVFLNLLSNALKYSAKRDRITVEVGTFTEEASGDTVFFVKDNGVGFDMRYVNKLFGVFQRLHRAEDYEGTGVGLAIVQRIVQRHGGRVWAEGEPDKGATFYFTLGGNYEWQAAA
ncbi:MAG TPA: ATP-binding protein [Candidatus Dormibacteraeota bacterium]|nr:ATP-binding protein [Candidatus Dormibacteraeota bacterium]